MNKLIFVLGSTILLLCMGCTTKCVKIDSVPGKNVDDVFDGGYDVMIKPQDIITKGPWVDVRAFGAKGDDNIDDTNEIQKAINAIHGLNEGRKGGILFFPTGVYRVDSTLNCQGSVIFKGAGMHSSVIRSSITDGSDLFKFEYTSKKEILQFIVFEDIYLRGNGTASGRALYFNNPYHVFLNRCVIYNHGSVGVEFYENPNKPSVYQLQTNIKDCFIHYNHGGGIRFGPGNNAYVIGCGINQNGYYGIYTKGMNQLMILNNEFAGYYYGSIDSMHKATPIILNGNNLITIEHNSFANNAGPKSESYNIRTGFDVDSLKETEEVYVTRNLLIRSNDFKPVGSNNQNLTHIRLNYAKNVTIQSNHFEASPILSGDFVGIEFGTFYYRHLPDIYFINNEWGNDLDEKIRFTGSKEYPYIWIDEHTIVNSKITEFMIGNSTPSVKRGNIFGTANTGATTITSFNDGTKGQKITVIFKDNNTTIDFSGTKIKGNGGVNWTPSYGDHMTCIYDGKFWYCDISDNTK